MVATCEVWWPHVRYGGHMCGTWWPHVWYMVATCVRYGGRVCTSCGHSHVWCRTCLAVVWWVQRERNSLLSKSCSLNKLKEGGQRKGEGREGRREGREGEKEGGGGRGEGRKGEMEGRREGKTEEGKGSLYERQMYSVVHGPHSAYM